MKKISAILSLLFLSSLSFAQKDFFIGTWKYEKIPDHLEMDEESTKMSNQFFKDMLEYIRMFGFHGGNVRIFIERSSLFVEVMVL